MMKALTNKCMPSCMRERRFENRSSQFRGWVALHASGRPDRYARFPRGQMACPALQSAELPAWWTSSPRADPRRNWLARPRCEICSLRVDVILMQSLEGGAE